MVQTTASAPPTTATTVGNIAGQGVNIYRGDHNRPISHATTTFGWGIKSQHRPPRLHQRAIYRSHLVLNYDDNQASYKSSQGFKFENCDLFHLHKGSRWSWVVTIPHSTSSRVKDITVPHLRPKNPSPRESSKALANHSGHTDNPRQL